MVHTKSNKKTAELMIAVMKYVIKYDYYPNAYFYLLELQNKYFNDLITNSEFEYEIDELHNSWIKK